MNSSSNLKPKALLYCGWRLEHGYTKWAAVALCDCCPNACIYYLSMLLYILFLSLFQISCGLPSRLPEEQSAQAEAGTGSSGGNSTVSHSSWVSAPYRRGTYELLLSCVATLFLCAWTAYHPNIPGKKTTWALLTRRSIWVVVAMIAPELVLAAACNQLYMAVKFRGKINALMQTISSGQSNSSGKSRWSSQQTRNILTTKHPQQKHVNTWPLSQRSSPHVPRSGEAEEEFDVAEENHTQRAPFTLKQAFFVLSGGVAVRSEEFYPLKHITFTADGVLELARMGILPSIPLDAIEDKAKASAFGKILVCFQAAWFFAECIGRLLQDLPLTLLEIHVFVHVICALCMYALWMRKPYDVGTPLYSTNKHVINVAALFAMAPFANDEERNATAAKSCFHDTVTIEQVRSAQESPIGNIISMRQFKLFFWDSFKTSRLGWQIEARDIDPLLCQKQLIRAQSAISWLKRTGYNLHWTEYSPKNDHWTEQIKKPHPNIGNAIDFDQIFVVSRCSNVAVLSDMADSKVPQKELPRATGCHHQYELQNLDTRGQASRSLDHPTQKIPHFHTGSTGKIPRKDWHELMKKYRLHEYLFYLFSAMYGGAHLVAWNSYFPTVVEMWMWRVSAAILAAGPLLWPTMVHAWRLDGTIERLRTRDGVGKHRIVRACVTTLLWLWRMILFFPWEFATSCVVVVYPFSRLYILVEAFVSLRDPAKGTYRTTRWDAFVPHVS